jgi:large subunit ribosomal protein L25
MTTMSMEATLRPDHGKGAARRTRKGNMVPGVVYGQGNETLGVAVAPKVLTKVLTTNLRRNILIDLQLKDAAGKVHNKFVMVKELQAHPVKRTPIHVDFIEVKKDKAVTVSVPLVLTGKSKAATAGAAQRLIVRGVRVSVLPDNIPESISFDTTEAGFGVIRAKSIKLPAGLKLVDSPEFPVASLKMPRGEKEEAAAAPAAAAADLKAAGAKGAAPAAAAGKDAKAAPAADAKKK